MEARRDGALQVQGLPLHVLQRGEGPETLLLLHGAMTDAMQNWRMVLGPLAEAYTVLAPDQRGHGQTPWLGGPLRLEDLVGDALGILDALGVAKAHVLGASMGGYVGLAMRAVAPERVASLALAGVAVGRSPKEAKQRASWFTPEAIAERYPLWAPQLAKAHGHHHGPEHWKHLAKAVGEWLASEVGGHPALSWERLAEDRDLLPLLWAVGDRDELVPLSQLERLRELRPDAELLVAPKAGHLFRDMDQELFLRAYRPFLRRQRSTG